MSRRLPVVLSLALHVVAGIAIAFAPRPSLRPRVETITVDVRTPRPATPASPVVQPVRPIAPPPVPPPPTPQPRKRHAPSEPPPLTPPPPAPGPSDNASDKTGTGTVGEAPPTAPTTPAPPSPGAHKIDLFPSGVLSTVAGGGVPVVARNTTGITRRAGDGLPAPGTRDLAAEREEAGRRVRDVVADLTGAERAASGNLPPAWRDAERQVGTSFAPPVAYVTDDNRVQGWLKEMMKAPPASGPTPRGIDPSAQSITDLQYQQQLTGFQPRDKSLEWTRCEIEVTVDSKGNLVASRVVLPSGRRKFDQAALETVRKAVTRNANQLRDPAGSTAARWSVSAAVAVVPPVAAGFAFDEVTGKVKGVYPMQTKVVSDVRLLSVHRAD